ncbi:MAG: Hsp33 family molecular chaperone HslO [Chromatiales bacterium]|jgi:molecular chaperone Hsp33|nr:Hsp33 family molecular chaperone HslO [Chromatiales bacterium]
MTQDTDCIRRFIIDGSNVRGVRVHLQDVWQEMLARNPYPAPVATLLGEALAGASLLAATIKIDGSLTLQTSGDGPVTMVVVQATGARTVRGMASVRGELDALDFASLVGTGHLAITIDPGTGKDRYQGIIALEGESLAAVVESYFETSEQLPTRLWLASDGDSAAGFLLQLLPSGDAEPDMESWEHCVTLAETLKGDELLGLDTETLLRRLFHAEPVRLFNEESMQFYCRCSRNRVSDMLRNMPCHELVADAQEQGGSLSVSCDFCNANYVFDVAQIEGLYAAPAAVSEPTSH